MWPHDAVTIDAVHADLLLRVVREANDGKRDRTSYTNPTAALEAARTYLAIPGTYQVTVFVME